MKWKMKRTQIGVEDSRQQCFLNVPPQLFSSHDDHQLCAQLNQTASGVTLGQQEVFAFISHTFVWWISCWNQSIYEAAIMCWCKEDLCPVHFDVGLKQVNQKKPHLFIPQIGPFAKHVGIVTRIIHKFAFKEGYVETWGIVVDELEHEHLRGQPVLILQVGFGDFCRFG